MSDKYKDIYWAKIAASQFRNFRQIDEFRLIFSCPICGDSKKDNKKARGNIYSSDKGIIKYKCFNCNAGPMSISEFLRTVDINTYQHYRMDFYNKKTKKDKNNSTNFPKIKLPKFEKNEFNSAWDDNNASSYLESRNVPQDKKIFFHKNFTKWTKEKLKRDIAFIPKEDPRVILEARGKKKEIIGYIGRTISNSTLRYNNVKVNKNYPNLVFGLDNINNNTPIKVVEGAFDSLFLENSIAISSSALPSATNYFNKEQLILIYDNEPRSREITSIMSKSINQGFKVVIWPNRVKEKDINEMVNSGIKVEEIIAKNTFKGLEAKLNFNQWVKV